MLSRLSWIKSELTLLNWLFWRLRGQQQKQKEKEQASKDHEKDIEDGLASSFIMSIPESDVDGNGSTQEEKNIDIFGDWARYPRSRRKYCPKS